jgi:hypothetical protein
VTRDEWIASRGTFAAYVGGFIVSFWAAETLSDFLGLTDYGVRYSLCVVSYVVVLGALSCFLDAVKSVEGARERQRQYERERSI